MRVTASQWKAFAAVALATLAASSEAQTAPQPTLAGAPRFVLEGDGARTFRAFVYSSGAALDDVAVRAALVQAKDGTSRPLEAVKLAWPRGELAGKGRTLELLVPDLRPFSAGGDYEVQLQFSWSGVRGATDGVPGVVMRTVTLVRPVPSYSLMQELLTGERIVTVRRSWPGAMTGTAELDVPVAGAQIPSLAVTGETLVGKDSGLVGARLEGTRVPSPDPAAPQVVKVTVPALAHAGTYAGSLLLTGPGLAQTGRVSVQVRVSDQLWFPLLAICGGVLLAWLFTWLSGTWRDRELYELVRASAAADLAAWLARVTRPEKKDRLSHLEAQLAATVVQAAAGEYAAARTQVDAVAKAIAEFAGEEAKARMALGVKLRPVRADVDAWRKSGKPPADPAAVKELEAALERAERLLEQLRCDEAEPAVEEALKLYGNVPGRPAPSPAPPARTLTIERQVPAWWHLRRKLRGPRSVAVAVRDASGTTGEEYVWRAFRPGQERAASGRKPDARFDLPVAGRWDVEVLALRTDGSVAAEGTATIDVDAPAADPVEGHARRLRKAQRVLTGIAIVVASLTGLSALWVNKPFGTAGDYLLAILWGFGIDGTVRGFSTVLGKLRSGS